MKKTWKKILPHNFRCLDELGRWKDLEKVAVPIESTNRMEDKFESIWENPQWVDTLLPYVIRSQLRSLIENPLEEPHSLAEFFNGALNVPQRKELLMQRYSFELALFSIRQNRDHATGYLDATRNSLLEDWAGTPQLNFHSRRKQLPKLQLLEEARRTVTMFVDCNLHPENEKKLKEDLITFLVDEDRELGLKDPVSVWSDVLTNRCFYVKKIEQLPGVPGKIKHWKNIRN